MTFSPYMILILILSFFGISFFLGMLLHSAFMYKENQNLKRDSKKAWVLCMVAGVGVTFWMFVYGYYVNFFM